MKYIINLPWTKPPLSLNDRKHYMAKAKENKAIFNQVLTLATAAALPKHLNHVTVQLHYRPADNRRRDTDNLIASAKPMYDALSVAGTGKQSGYGVVQDDDHIHMSKPEPRIHSHSKGEPPMMWLEITTGDGERRGNKTMGKVQRGSNTTSGALRALASHLDHCDDDIDEALQQCNQHQIEILLGVSAVVQEYREFDEDGADYYWGDA